MRYRIVKKKGSYWVEREAYKEPGQLTWCPLGEYDTQLEAAQYLTEQVSMEKMLRAANQGVEIIYVSEEI